MRVPLKIILPVAKLASVAIAMQVIIVFMLRRDDNVRKSVNSIGSNHLDYFIRVYFLN